MEDLRPDLNLNNHCRANTAAGTFAVRALRAGSGEGGRTGALELDWVGISPATV